MKYQYINKPPELIDAPAFLVKKYGKFDGDLVYALVAWAKKEYYDVIHYLYQIKDLGLAHTLEYDHSPETFIAHSELFREMAANMTSEIWSTLDRATQEALMKAMDIRKYSRK